MTEVALPGGGRVLARALRNPVVPDPAPTFGLYLLGHPPDRPSWWGRRVAKLTAFTPPWPSEWVLWRDLQPPHDRFATARSLIAVHKRIAAGERVEVACGAGTGRTGTALACLYVCALRAAGDARAPKPVTAEAVDWAREVLSPRAVQTSGQRRYVAFFARRLVDDGT